MYIYVVKLPYIFNFKGQVFIFRNIFCLSIGTLWIKGTAISVTSAVAFCLSMNTVSGLLKPTVLSVIYKSFVNVCDVMDNNETMTIGLPMETKTTDGGCQIFPLNFQLEFHYFYLRKIVQH